MHVLVNCFALSLHPCAMQAVRGAIVLCTSTSRPGSMRPLFGRTQYLRSRLLAGRGGAGDVGRFVLLGRGGFDLQSSASRSEAFPYTAQQRAGTCLP